MGSHSACGAHRRSDRALERMQMKRRQLIAVGIGLWVLAVGTLQVGHGHPGESAPLELKPLCWLCLLPTVTLPTPVEPPPLAVPERELREGKVCSPLWLLWHPLPVVHSRAPPRA